MDEDLYNKLNELITPIFNESVAHPLIEMFHDPKPNEDINWHYKKQPKKGHK